MSKALLFSGQGSQYVGMLKEVSSKFPSIEQKLNQANEILGFDIKEIMFEGPAEKLKETRYTQPALFLHSACLFDLIKDKLEYSVVAGHSVGEFAALYAAGVISFEDSLKLVALRGNLMFTAGEKVLGTMFAVIGVADEKVEEICNTLTQNGNGNVVVAANFNSTGQVVVSGSAEYLRANASAFKEGGAKMVSELQVSGAFHSPLMQPAKEELEAAINKISFNNANVPVYVNISGLPVSDANELKISLIKQLTSAVRWTQTMNNMHANSINAYIEIGPSKVLQGLTKRTLSGVEISGFDTFADIEKIIA